MLFGVSHGSIRCALRQTERAINPFADLDAFGGAFGAVRNMWGNPRVGKRYGVRDD